MKRLFRKDNRIARFIALALVLIMALTPLYQNAGLKKPTMAAPSDGKDGKFTLNVGINDYITNFEESNITLEGTDYSITGDGKIHNVYFWCRTTETIDLRGELIGTLKYQGTEGIGYDAVARVYDAGTTSLDSTVAANDADIVSVDSYVTIAEDEIYAIYVKVNEFTHNDATVSSTNNEYHLVTAFKLVPSWESYTMNWVDSEGNNAGSIVNSAALPAQGIAQNDMDVYLGSFEYSYAKKKNNSTTYTDYTGTNSPTVINPNQPVSVISGSDGNYIGFAMYIDDEGATGICKTASVEFDTTAPVLQEAWNQIKVNNTNNVVQAENGVKYLDTTTKYDLIFRATEINTSEKLTLGFYKKDSTEPVNTLDVDKSGGNTVLKYGEYQKSDFIPAGLEENTLYDIKVELVDSIGNPESNREVTLATVMFVDKTLKAGVDIQDEDGTSIGDNFGASRRVSNKTHKATVTITSGKKLQWAKFFAGSEELKYYNLVDMQEDVAGGLNKATVEYTFNNEREYNNVYLVVNDDDWTDKTFQFGSFTYDKTNPDVKYVGLFKYDDQEDEWERVDVEGKIDSTGNYWIDKTTDDTYRVVYGVKEEGSGVKASNYYIGASETPSALNPSVNPTTTMDAGYTEYSIQLDTDTILGSIDPTTMSVAYKANVVDQADNLSGDANSVTIMVADDTAKIDDVLLEKINFDNSETVVDVTASDDADGRYSGKGHKLTVTVSSGYELESITISDANPDAVPYTQVEDLTGKATFNDITKRYVAADVEIIIPKEIGTNILINGATITLTDKKSGTPQSVSKDLGKLLYDETEPELTDVKPEEVSFDTTDETWYKEYEITANIKPGKQAVESGITYVAYTVSNAIEGNGETEIFQADATNPPVISVPISVVVPESANADGTKITFNATDKAGNPLEEETKIKVDATAPTVESIKINDEDVKTTSYGPSIKITTDAKDNLSLDTVTITVQKKQEDGTYANVEAEETFNISTEGITSQTFTYPRTLSLADGDYKVTVIAKDKSGRTSADDTDVTNEEIFFTVNGALTAEGTIYTLADYEAGNTENGRTSFDTKNVDDTVTHTVSNQKHKLVVEVRSGYDFETCLLKSGTELKTTLNFTDKKYENGFYTAKVEYTFGEHGSVKYEDLYIEVKDKNPDTIKSTVSQSLGTFIYDEDAPKAEFEGLYISKDDGATWRRINDDPWSDDTDIVDWAYVINVTSPTDRYRFVYDVEENTSGIKDDLALHGKKIEENTEETKMSTSSTNVEYIAEFSTAELAADIEKNGFENGLRYNVKFVDNASNEFREVGPWYSIRKPDNTIGLDAVLYKLDGEGNRVAVNLNGDDYYANTPYVLEVKTSTMLGIDSIILYDGTDSANPVILSTRTVTDQENEDGWNEPNKLFNVVVDIQVPYFEDEADVKNLILNNMYVKAIDRAGVETEPQLLGSMLYDQTLPILVNNKSSDGTLSDDPRWYAEYAFDALITPGPQGENAIESQIGTASYTMTGSVDEKENQTLDIEDGKVKVTFDVPESNTLAGTTIVFNASDMAGNQLESNNVAVIRVDATKPSIDEVNVYDENGYEDLVGENVTIDMTATDNLGFEKLSVKVEQLTGGTATFSRDFDHTKDEVSETNTEDVVINDIYSLSGLDDGTYKVTITAYDKANTPSDAFVKEFEVDGKLPTNNVKISSGTMGGKKPMENFDGTDRDYYYKSDVVVELTYTEKNAGAIVVKDGDTTVTGLQWNRVDNSDTYVAKHTVKQDGLHNISISVSDMTGHSSKTETISFIKDTKSPAISVLMNGAINYDESMGQRLSTTDTTLAFTETEDNKDEKGFYYKVKKSVPDETPVVGKYGVTPHRSFTYSEEAEYEVQVYSVDMANNTSLTRTVQFRIDKTAPNISIGGITSGGTSSTAVTLSFNMQELYWRDAEGTVQIYVKSGEGFGEELVEEFAYTPNGRNSVMTRTLSESGIYRVEFVANDSAQHTAEASSTFTIDTEVPVVTLEGVTNFDVTDQDVTITSTITDKFYASKKVTISGTMTDETGKVTPITIDDYSPTANPTIINKTFSADGIYDLTITCVDVAGNSDSKSVHFTIDKSEPIIGDLSHIDGKILTSFTWEEDLDELVSDLTVCDVHMYLNGQEYNGEDAVEDGSYVLLITAEDELGHKVEKSVEFVLDTKAPVFIVTGVEDKEKKLEPYNISVSLQLDEDSLTKVTLNDKVITITNNMATFDVTEVGEYKLYMEATDEAGNVSSAEYEFELMSEKEFNFWIILAILALLMIIVIIIIILKKKKNKE